MATIDTLPPINISGTNATLQIEVLSDGDPNGMESWAASIGYKPQSSDTWIWLDYDITGVGEGIIQRDVTGLYPNIQYEVTSWITNSAGTSYGDIETFSIEVQSSSPSVATLPAKNITYQSSELELTLLNNGEPSGEISIDTRFIYWKKEGQQKSTNWFSTTEGQTSSFILSGLDPDTLYSFFAEAKNSNGQVTGDTLSFRTLPDPNSVPIVFDSNEPDTIYIQNFVKAIQVDCNQPHNNQGILTYTEKPGNLANLDSNDVLYSNNHKETKTSKIVSLLPKTVPDGELVGFYELSKDMRPGLIDANDSNNPLLLELSICSDDSIVLETTSENSLKFWIYNDNNSIALNDCFNGKTLTIQQISSDPNEPNQVYPLWDIRKVIEKNGRQITLDQLNTQKSNIPYAFFEFSTTKELLDINGDNNIDAIDYSILLKDFGKEGIFRSDIASEKSFGLPDGKVDLTDELTFIKEYNKLYPENPIPNPYVELSEDFESGSIQYPFTSSGDATWLIDSDSYSGNYSVRSGDISGNQVSILEADINNESQRISFNCKVSCESRYDLLIFLIDNFEAGSWSGQVDWQKVDFEITPGTHNYKWIYIKDEFMAEGQDCVWIDNIEFSLY